MRKVLFALVALALAMPVGLVHAKGEAGRKVASEKKTDAKKKGAKKGAKGEKKKKAKKAKKAGKKGDKVAKKKGKKAKKAARSSSPRVDAPMSQAPAEYKEPSNEFDVPEDLKDDLPPPNNGILTE